MVRFGPQLLGIDFSTIITQKYVFFIWQAECQLQPQSRGWRLNPPENVPALEGASGSREDLDKLRRESEGLKIGKIDPEESPGKCIGPERIVQVELSPQVYPINQL